MSKSFLAIASGLLAAGLLALAQVSTPPSAATLGIVSTIPASCANGPGVLLQRNVNADLVTLSQCVNGQYQTFWRAEHFADNVLVSGARDGSNRVFTLPTAPRSRVLLSMNGLVLAQNLDYSLNGQTITFFPNCAAPVATDVLQAWYRY